MSIRPVNISELFKEAKETTLELIRSRAFSLYPAFITYSLTVIFLCWIAKIVLF